MQLDPSGLHDRPVLALDPGRHVAPIAALDVDQGGRFAVTGSDDKTVRVWSIADGRLERTIRVPAGPGNLGRIYAVAISPDGATIAAGGWTSLAPPVPLYLFDRASGTMITRIDGLPNVALDLAFSPQGDRLAVALADGWGPRLFARLADGAWSEAAAADGQGADGYGLAFAPDGRLAASAYDGSVRLYDERLTCIARAITPHPRPHHLAFDPTGERLAVGFDAPLVALFDGSLLPLPTPDLSRITHGTLSSVAWSADGRRLYAGGRFHDARGCPLLAWDDGAPAQLIPLARNTVAGLPTLPDGGLVAATQDPWIGRLDAGGTPVWATPPAQIDLRQRTPRLTVSPDGQHIGFPTGPDMPADLAFDAAALTLAPAVAIPADAPPPTPPGPRQTRARAAIPGGDRIAGTDFALHGFDATEREIWQQKAPSVVCGLAVAETARLAVASYGDGTLRWHRTEDGAELLALFPLPDGESWVAWTPEGLYAATPSARPVLGWHVNHGWGKAAELVPAAAIPETHRPDVLRHVLAEGGTAGALAVAELARVRAAVQRATGSDVAPGARLHTLAIGVSDHGAAAGHLALAYAARDAQDLAAALAASQASLYGAVLSSILTDADATKAAIFAELAAMAAAMRPGDTALVFFSGHGTMLGDSFHLLPHGVDAASTATLKATGLRAADLRDEIAGIARHGRALLFLDACRSGGLTAPLERSLKAALTAPNLAVFTSSRAGELSVEDDAWQNGAFTEALLEALAQGDADGDTLIRISDLARHLSDRVPALTGGRQHPEVEIGFEARILAATG